MTNLSDELSQALRQANDPNASEETREDARQRVASLRRRIAAESSAAAEGEARISREESYPSAAAEGW
jgi:hypothetical protein